MFQIIRFYNMGDTLQNKFILLVSTQGLADREIS